MTRKILTTIIHRQDFLLKSEYREQMRKKNPENEVGGVSEDTSGNKQ